MYIELTPRGILTTFFRQFWKMVLVFILVFIAGVYFLQQMPTLYASSSKLLINFGPDAVPNVTLNNGQGYHVSENRRETVASYVELLKGRDLIAQAVEQVGAERLYPPAPINEQSAQSQKPNPYSPLEEATMRVVNGDLKIDVTQPSNMIELQYRNGDPELAQEFIQALLELFIARQIELYNNPQTGFLSQELLQAKSELDEAQEAFQKFKSRKGVSNIDEELTELLRQRREASILGLEAINSARQELTELEAKEAEILANYRPDSPNAIQIRQRIENARHELAQRQRDAKVSGITSTGTLAEHMENIDRRIKSLEVTRSEYNNLTRQVTLAEDTYKSLLMRTEKAKIDDRINKERISRISVVEQPDVAKKPVSPRRKLILFIIIFAAGFMALGVAIVLELIDERYTTPEQLFHSLRVPVLATFTKKEELKDG